MKVRLTGYKKLDFKADGEKVQGLQLFICYKSPDVTGECTDKVFIRADQEEILLVNPSECVGSDVDMEFDRKGHLLCVSAI